MSIVPARPKRPVVIGSLAATALLGLGVTAGVGITAVGHHPTGDGAVTRTAVALAVSSIGRSAGSATPAHDRDDHRLQAALRDVHGRQVGWIRLTPLARKRLLIQVHATHLTPGFHGIHVHSVGVCDPAGTKPFSSAGPHLNPTHTAEGMQAGALPVLLANPDGTADAQIIDAHFTLADLRGTTGASVVVHAGTDNYANIPPRYQAGGTPGPDAETQMTGDAGARVACAVLVRPTATPTTGTATPAPRRSAPTPTTGMPATGMPTTGMPGPGTPGTQLPTPTDSPTTTPTPTPTVLYGKHW